MKLNYSSLFNKSWDSIKDNLPLVAGLTLVYMVGLIAVGCIPWVRGLITTPFTAGYLVCLIKIRRREDIGYADIFWGFMDFGRFLQLVLLSVIVSVLTIASFICLVIPGIWFVVAASMATTYFVIDQPDAINALKKSLAAVKGHWWQVFGLMILCGLLSLVGILCFLIGILLALPMVILLFLNAAEELKAGSEKQEGPTPASGPSVLNVNPS